MGPSPQRLRGLTQALLIVALVAWAAALTRLSTSWSLSRRTQPRAEHGTLDLTTWDWEARGPVYLIGEWEFYWNRCVEPAEVAASPPASPPGTLWRSVPGLWKERADRAWPGEGCATYILRAHLPSSTSWLSLKIPYQRTAYRLWANGTLVATNGQVGPSRTQSRAQYLPQTVVLPQLASPAAQPLVLVMQISNFQHRAGGFYQPLLLGTPSQVNHLDARALLVDWLIMAFIVSVGLHHLTLYALWRRERAALYLGVLSVVMVVRMLVMREMYWVRWFPSFPWELHLKIEYWTTCALVPLLVSFAQQSLPQVIPNRLPRLAAYVSFAYALLVLLTPARLYSRTASAYQVGALLLSAYLSTRGLEAVQRRLVGALPFLGGTICLTLAVTHDVLTTAPLPSSSAWMPAGLAVGILLQALMTAQRFANALRSQEQLSAELKHSRRLIVEADEQLRREVSTYLHGHVQGQLLAAWLQLGQSLQYWKRGPRHGRRLVEQVRRNLDHLREQEIRQLSHRLYPSILTAGLIPALYSLLDRFHTPNIRLVLDRTLPTSLPDELELAVYRLIEEALNNSLRHAHAHSATVALSRLPSESTGPEHLQVRIEDNGCGFDPTQVQMGFGLAVATARVEDLDGSWQLDSTPGHGTRITAVLPIAARSHPPSPLPPPIAPIPPVTPTGTARHQ